MNSLSAEAEKENCTRNTVGCSDLCLCFWLHHTERPRRSTYYIYAQREGHVLRETSSRVSGLAHSLTHADPNAGMPVPGTLFPPPRRSRVVSSLFHRVRLRVRVRSRVRTGVSSLFPPTASHNSRFTHTPHARLTTIHHSTPLPLPPPAPPPRFQLSRVSGAYRVRVWRISDKYAIR